MKDSNTSYNKTVPPSKVSNWTQQPKGRKTQTLETGSSGVSKGRLYRTKKSC